MSIRAYQNAAQRTRSPLETELWCFDYVNRQLTQARDGGDTRARIAALHDNFRLWSYLMGDLQTPENGLPLDLKRQLLTLAAWSMRYCMDAMTSKKPLDPLIDTNTEIAQGLKEQAIALRQPGEPLDPAPLAAEQPAAGLS
jgi:flagellar biosynthesis activator protein FlaF